MNTIYRIVWNATIGKWVVASELAKGRSKSGSSKKSAAALASAVAFIGMSGLGAAALGYAPAAAAQSTETFASFCAVTNSFYNTYSGSGFGSGGQATNDCGVGNGRIATWAGGENVGGPGNWLGLNANNTQLVVDGDQGKLFVRAGGANGHVMTMSDAANGVQLSGVATGRVAADSTDAINGSQLFDVTQTVNNISQTISAESMVKQDPTSHNITVAKDLDGSVVDMTGTSGARTVTGVAAGAVNAGSTDAVNGGQLHANSQSVANALGGGSAVNSDGTLSTPTYSLNGGKTTANSVAGAIKDIDGRTTQNASDIAGVQSSVSAVQGDITTINNQLSAGGLGLVQQDPISRNITVAKNADGTVVDVTGAAGVRTITGVKAGAVTASSADAVNGGQLRAVSQSVANTLGGGTTVDDNGALTGTSFDVNGGKYSTLQGAITAAAQSGGGDNPYIGGVGSPTVANPAASATSTGSVALGLGSVANSLNTVSVGNAASGLVRRITNVADATGANDAANWGQVQSLVSGETANSVAQFGAQISQVNETMNHQAAQLSALAAMPQAASLDTYVVVDNDGTLPASVLAGSYGVAAGQGATVGKSAGIAIGLEANSNASSAIAIGAGSSAIGEAAVALGKDTQANNSGAVAVGNGAVASSYATAIGMSAQASNNAVAIGFAAHGNAIDAIALGTLASVATQNSVAIGRLSSVTSDGVNSVALGFGSKADRANTVSVGKLGAERQITNVAAGTVGTDAVNVSQLAGVADALGGGSTIDANGKLTKPAYTVGGTTVDGVDGAVSALDTRINDMALTGGGDALNWDATAGAYTASHGSSTTNKIVNVADGAIASGSTDAINGGQLSSTLDEVYNGKDGKDGIDGLNAKVAEVINGKDGKDGIDGLNAKVANAVMYDADDHGKITLGGAGGTTIAGVKNAVNADEAVNKGQMDAQVSEIYNGKDGQDGIDGLNAKVAEAINGKDGKDGIDGLNAKMANAVMYDGDDHGKVTFAGAGGTVLDNVANGAVSAASRQAINGSQLLGTAQSMADILGGGSMVDASGKLTKPAYTVGGTTVNGVDGAVSALDTRINDITVSGGGDALNWNSTAGAYTASHGSSTTNKIVNVADGAIASGSKDAINGGQLSDTLDEVYNGKDGADGINGLNAKVAEAINGKDGKDGIDGLNAKMANAVMYDGDDHGKVTFAGAGGTVLDNVANAAVSAASRQAINGSQLYNTANSVAGALGGGVSVNADGSISAPTYALNGGKSTVHSVGGALADLDGRTTANSSDIATVQGDIVNITNQLGAAGTGLVQQDAVSKAITVAATTAGTSIDVSGTAGARTLSGLRDGKLAAGSTEAVTGSQLNTTNTNLANLSGTVDGIDTRVTKNTGDITNLSTSVTKIDGRVTTVENTVNDITNQLGAAGVGLVQQDAATKAITVAKATGGTSINVAGTDGDRTISGVKDGEDDNDAVNVKQLKDAGLIDSTTGEALNAVVYDNASRNSITFGGPNASAPVILHNVGPGEISANSTDAVNGAELYALQTRVDKNASDIAKNSSDIASIANGNGGTGGGKAKLDYVDGNATGSSSAAANAGTTAGVAVGYNSTASGDNASVLGQNATALGSYGTAIGNDSYAAGPKDTAIGGQAKVHADGSVAVGANTTVAASATNSVAVGADSAVNATQGVAIGQGATVATSAPGAVALGQGSVATDANTVSVGSVGNERRISNVAAGTQATDAANVGQLQEAMGGVQNWANQKFQNVNRNINRMGAMSAAYGQMAFSAQGLQTDNKVGMGIGTQNGQQAIAVGYSRQVGHNVNLSFGASASASEASVGAGLSMGW